MEPPESKVEVSLHAPKVQSFLTDLIELCSKHKVSIESSITTNTDFDSETKVVFHSWDSFSNLEVDFESASMYWPRIQTDIVVRRKNEQRKSKEDC